jgi:hypothetical protein
MKTRQKHWTDKYLKFNPCASGLRQARRYGTKQEWWADTDNYGYRIWLLEEEFGSYKVDKLDSLVRIIENAANRERSSEGPYIQYAGILRALHPKVPNKKTVLV